jgi:uncharacterized protein (TIGR02996 family)
MALGGEDPSMSQDRTETAFLHDICQNPADDAVRLIYADWLDDRGLPGDAERAEFIRFQVRLGPSDGVWVQTPLPEVPASVSQQWQWRWRRGFIEAISLSLVDFQAHAARLFASHPVQHVTLTDREPADRHGIGLQWYYWDEEGNWPLPQSYGAIQEAVPLALYDFLPFGKVYASVAEAHSDLSLACVRWGRQQAGLLEGIIK